MDPVGTAGWYRGFLLIDVALPWPRDVGLMDHLDPVRKLLDGRDYRLQATVPDGSRRVVVHGPACSDADGWFAGYRRLEGRSGTDVATTVGTLLAGAGEPSKGVSDLLVCTHGRRDVCCGSLGTELFSNLAGDLPGPVEMHRTSHTGGHRFAPTFVLLPQGTMWAYADTRLVHRVLQRAGAFADVAGHYRGCSGLGPAPVQALERAVLCEAGWELLDRRRRGFATGEEGSGGARYRLEADGGQWEAVVRPGRTVPVPDCKRPISEAKKSDTEWVVSDLRSV